MSKNKNRIILRIIELAKPFIHLFVLTIFFNTLFSALQAFAINLINPVLTLLFFQKSPGAVEKVASSSAPLNVLDQNFFKNWKHIIDDWVSSIITSPNDKLETLINLGIFLIIVFVLKNLFKYIAGLTGVRLEQGLIKSIRDKTFAKLTTLRFSFFKINNEGELLSILTNDIVALNQKGIMSITVILRDSVQVLAMLALLLMISVKLVLISLISFGFGFIIITVSRRYIKKYARRMQESMADYTSTMQESIAGIRIIKAFNAEKFVNRKFQKDSLRFFKAAFKSKVVNGAIPAITEIIAICSLCGVMFIGGKDVLNGRMEPNDLLTFLFLLFGLMSPAVMVVNQFTRFQTGMVSAERIFRVLDSDETMPSGKYSVSKLEHGIEVNDVQFAYDKDCAALGGVSLKIEKNKKTAFVGPSGSGKSTMLDLLIRYYDPTNGSISVDGKDIRDLDTKNYRDLFGIVSQETILFNDTVAKNISYGNIDIPRDDIIEAAKKANAYDFIMKLPKGFDTVIGNRGTNLSGGERQRVAIARALAKNPEILVFDEATSALDTKSEKVVQSAIENSLGNKTAIIVAHRLSTIKNCDNIIVFDKGQIVESGSHDELLQKQGLYHKLCKVQTV